MTLCAAGWGKPSVELRAQLVPARPPSGRQTTERLTVECLCERYMLGQGLKMDGSLDRRSVLASGLAATVDAVVGARSGELKWFQADDFLASVGLNGHLGQAHTPYTKSFDAVLSLLSDLGVRRWREDLGFSIHQGRGAGQFARIREAAAAGFRFSLICFDGVHSPVNVSTKLIPQIFEWCDGAVDFFEGPNEPFVGRLKTGPMMLKKYQQSLYQTVRSHGDLRGVRILGPSLIQEQIQMAEPMEEFVDCGNIHPYPGFLNPETTTDASLQRHIVSARRVFGDRPVVITETGYHTALATKGQHLPVPEEIKTRYIPRLLLWSFQRNIGRTYLYEGVSSFARGDADPESSFGLLQNDLSPTPSYHAVKNLLAQFRPDFDRMLKGAPLSVRIERGPSDLVCLGFRRRDGAYLIAFWRGREGWNAHSKTLLPTRREMVSLNLTGRARSVRLHRFLGDGRLSSSRLTPQGNVLRVDVEDGLAIAVLT